MASTRSQLGGHIQGCADGAGIPEGFPVSVITQPGESVDVNVISGVGGGAVTIADGADVNSGSTTDAAVFGDVPGTLSAKLRGLASIIDGWNSLAGSLVVSVAQIPNGVVLGDTLVNPSTPLLGGCELVYNATSGLWERVRTANSANATAGDGIPASGGMVWHNSNSLWRRAKGDVQGNAFVVPKVTSFSMSDATTNSPQIWADEGGTRVECITRNLDFNNFTWDRRRNNSNTVGLASGVRNATQTISFTNYNGRGITVVLNITALGAGTTWTVSIDEQDVASTNFVNVLTGAAVAAAGTTRYRVYPGIPAVANVDAAVAISRAIRVQIIVGGTALNSTFSVGIHSIL